MELIRINPDHYVIADDSDIKEGDYFLNETSAIEVGIGNYHYKTLSPECKQITHSTKPLESCCTPVGQIKRYEDCYGCDRKPKQEKLTYTESAKKEERISNCTMMKRKRETLEEIAKRYGIQVYKGKMEKEFDKKCITETLEKAVKRLIKLNRQDAFYEGAKWQMDKQSDFIIGFLEFIEGTYSYSNIYDHWYLHANTSKTYSKKQLLEVYLKRNKL